MRAVSWNLMFRSAAAARRQGELLRELKPDLALLQEVNPGAAGTLQQAAGADWLAERALPIETTVEGLALTAASYHAPPGVNWKIDKARRPSPSPHGCQRSRARCCWVLMPTPR